MSYMQGKPETDATLDDDLKKLWQFQKTEKYIRFLMNKLANPRDSFMYIEAAVVQ